MTADLPEVGTPEYKEAIENKETGKYIKARYKLLAYESRHIPPEAFRVIDNETKADLREILNAKEDDLRAVAYVSIFANATGGMPQDPADRRKLLSLICPLLVEEGGQDIAGRLSFFMLSYRFFNLIDHYRNGDIKPELARALNDTYDLTTEFYSQHNILHDKAFLIAYLLGEGKLDFSPFKGKADKGSEWYYDYRISTKVLNVASGMRQIPLDSLAETAGKNYIAAVDTLKAEVKRRLAGAKPTEEWLADRMNLKGEALASALNDYVIKPIPFTALLQFADAVAMQYHQREKEHTGTDYAAPFVTEQEAGFYVNPVTCEIFDLRPYAKDLNSLLSVKSWQYLDDFAGAVRLAVAEYRAELETEHLKNKPQKISVQKAKKINYPVDKVNNNLWGTLEGDTSGQLAFSTVKTGKGKEVTILAAINFVNMEGIQITKKLNNFDKRVYIAVAALWNAGNEVITLTQIHYAMGNTQRPSKNQLEKINEAVSKMTTAKLFLDNANEIDKLKYKYKKFKYDGALLPMERMTATVKGQLSDAAIHIFREPPLMTFARERNQITTFDVKLLQSPVSKTDGNLAIEDYLLERIAGAKQAAGKEKKVIINNILYETLFQKVGISGRMQKARTVEKVKTYLDYYKESGYIKNYVAEADKVTFFF